ncbi:tail fiber protein [Paenibacillus doosanensis]|uniref:Phage Tail Collar Domain protein n=1 Tax=Paenibacillus konkukensis TaxID=2020716 RepID=A0ABY4RNY0_9BACL|nr:MULTISPECIES: tail fiber protein [Paenibacillus]MCS7459124.1 tail fiber protein [Paenibacillus doosanensis]UQZ84181.1 Phage Tail Collar Domain protein [Paenibacillus konkukensis]
MDPFVAEIRIFAGDFAPKGWALCNGQLLSIAQNTALFSLLGTTYGGDGKSTFALPNLMGRAPMHPRQGPGLTLRSPGESGGSQTVTLLNSQLPAHNHEVYYGPPADNNPVEGSLWAATPGRVTGQAYGTGDNKPAMSHEALLPAGGNQPHNNMQPYLGLNYIIALQGVFPPRG